MRQVVAILIALAVVGCAAHRGAYLEFVRPFSGADYYQINVSVPTGEWEAGVAHGLVVAEGSRLFSLRLPGQPPDSATYSYSQLLVFESGAGIEVIRVTGGIIELSLISNTIQVSLQTETGSFWGNGRYPLRQIRN